MSYRLNDYADFKKIIVNNDYAKEKHLIVKNYGNLYLIKYDKSFLNINNYESLGLFRSVIVNKEGTLVSYSPPKSYNLNLDTCSTKNVFKFEDYELQPFIEGTMINLFWHPYLNDWEITTRSFISAKNKFSTPNTFRYMFLQSCNDINLHFDNLDKKYSYSFVMQHIENRIVVPIIDNALFLVNVYEFKDGTVYCKDLKEFNDKFINSTVSILKPDVTLANINSFNRLISFVNETDLDYKILGYICYNKNNGSRIKIRNPNYETVRHLKGNTPKIQFQYYYLRKNNKVREFLKFYPEHATEFSKLRHDLHTWTNHLYQHYVKCFIVKEKELINAPYEYKPHLYQLHKEYLNELMEQKKYITKGYIINYVNNLPPQRLMYAVNHKLKQQQVDNKIAEVLNK
jgi:hypothetical protein